MLGVTVITLFNAVPIAFFVLELVSYSVRIDPLVRDALYRRPNGPKDRLRGRAPGTTPPHRISPIASSRPELQASFVDFSTRLSWAW